MLACERPGGSSLAVSLPSYISMSFKLMNLLVHAYHCHICWDLAHFLLRPRRNENMRQWTMTVQLKDEISEALGTLVVMDMKKH